MTSRIPKLWPYLLALLVAAGVALGVGQAVRVDGEAVAFPFPVPVYEIEAISGDHEASILNLPLPYVGVPEVPIPVDVDGDLLPDVTTSVNLVDPEGLFNNPPDIAELIAPNIEIRRLITAPLLGQTNPPLRINVKLTLVDIQGEQGPTVVRFGYDTGVGGSIPTDFKAIVGGLADFFNPLVATVDTTGGFLGLDPGLPDLGLGPVADSYSGPLTLIGGLDSDVAVADLGLAFDPLPSRLEVTYGTDGEHQEITYAHASPGEVDVTTTADIQTEDPVTGDTVTTDVTAHVERLPRQMAVDIAMGESGNGSIDYTAASDGRLPDIAVDLIRKVSDDGEGDAKPPMIGRFEIEALPDTVHGDWNIVPNGGGAQVHFDSSGAGIGALGARIATFEGPTSPVIEPWTPSQEQFLHLATGPDGFAGDTLIEARLERIRDASFSQSAAGVIEADVNVGDGEQALEAHVDADLRTAEPDPGPRIEVTSTISPLPDHIGLLYEPAGEIGTGVPLHAVYDASETIDIDAEVDIALKDTPADAVCGDAHTLCGTVALRNLPSHLEVTYTDTPGEEISEKLIELETTPGEGAALPDVRADLILGPQGENPDPDARAMHLHGEVLGLPEDATVRIVQNEVLEELQEIDFDACLIVGDACAPNTDDSDIGEIRFQVANFAQEDRPENLPPPNAIAPIWASITSRGLPDPSEGSYFEAAGRITDVEEMRFLNVDGVLAARAVLGQGEDLAVNIDMQGIAADPEDPDAGTVDTQASALVQPLPNELQFCYGKAHRQLTSDTIDTITDLCESDDPFRDDSVPAQPMAIAYHGSEEFDVQGSFSQRESNLPGDLIDDTSTAATFDVTGVPKDISALIATPPLDTEGPIRVLTEALDVIDAVDLSFESIRGQADCDEQEPDTGDVLCATASVTDLPSRAAVYADTSVEDEINIEFHGCDWDIHGLQGCRNVQDGENLEIGTVAATVHIDKGSFAEVPPHHAIPEGQHAVVLGDLETPGVMALQADVAVNGIRHLVVKTTEDGIDANTDIGNGQEALALVGDVDMRAEGKPDAMRIVAEATVDPLPKTMTLHQHANPEDAPEKLLDVHATTGDVASSLEAHVEVFESDSERDRCGEAHSLCGDVTLDELPQTLDVHLNTSTVPLGGQGDPRIRRTDIELDLEPHQGQGKPNITAKAILGEDTFDLPIPLRAPIVAELNLEGVPLVVRTRLEQFEREVPDLSGDVWDFVALGLPTLASELRSIDIHTCYWDYENEECGENEEGETVAEGQLDLIEASGRTFLLRPRDFPPPATAGSPQYAVVTGRGSNFEGAVRFTDVKEVRYLNVRPSEEPISGRVTGFHGRFGGGGAFRVLADLENLRLGEMAGYDDALLDAHAEVNLTNLPTDIAFCMRDSDITPVPESVSSLTLPCEDDDPFEGMEDAPELDRTPLSINFDAHGVEIDEVTVIGTARVHEADPDDTDPPDLNIDGNVTITQLPSVLTAHVLMPPGGGNGPIVLRALAPQGPGSGLEIAASAKIRYGDAVCYDPRPDAEVYCFEARLEDFPEKVDVKFDPSLDENNLLVQTVGSADQPESDQLDVVGVKVDIQEGSADAIQLAHADLINLPTEVRGSLHLPYVGSDTPSLDITATPSVGEARIGYQNYVAPDPFTQPVPAIRLGVEPSDQFLHLRRRGEFTQAEAYVRSVTRAGFRNLRDGAGDPLDTMVINAGFADPGNIRAYIDMETPESDDPEAGALAGTRLIADATLTDVPNDVEVCFRPPRANAEDISNSGEINWCEDRVPFASGAMQIDSANPENPAVLLDINAFVRFGSTSGDRLMAAAATIEDLPRVVRAILPLGSSDAGSVLDIGGFTEVGDLDADPPVDPPAAALGTIDAEFATFDLEVDGYADIDRPFVPRIFARTPFPAKVVDQNRQHVSAVIAHGHTHVDARLGPESPGRRVQMLPQACELTPEQAPPDYPYFPDDSTAYTCIKLDLADADGDELDPLDVYFAREANEQRMELKDGGLTDLPPWIALTIATGAPEFEGDNETLRRPCRSFEAEGAADLEEGEVINCMAPLVRFDQPTESVLFGTFTYGDRDALFRLDGIAPMTPGIVPDLTSNPGADGGQWIDDWGPNPLGVRATFAKVHQAADSGEDPRVNVVRANVRLEVPKSLTVDQIQQWEGYEQEGTFQDKIIKESSDLRFRVSIRDEDGTVVGEIGRVAGLLSLSENQELLLGGAGDDMMGGFPLPGELDIEVYGRSYITTNAIFEGTAEDYFQINGRISTPISIGARFNQTGGNLQVAARADLYNLPAYPEPDELQYEYFNEEEPTFVVAIERPHPWSRPAAPPPEDTPPEDPCKPTKCSEMTANVMVAASFDFRPDPNRPPARRLEVFLRHNGAKNALELFAWQLVGGGGGPAEVSAAVLLEVDPFSVYFHRGIYGVGSFTLDMGGRATIPLVMDRVSHVKIEHNVLSLQIESSGSDGSGGVFILDAPPVFPFFLPGLPLAQLVIDWLDVQTWAIGIPVLMAFYKHPGSPVNLKFLNCAAGGSGLGPGITALNNQPASAWVIWPLDDPDIVFTGVFGPLGFLAKKIGPFFCFGAAVDIAGGQAHPNYEPAGHPIPRTDPPVLPEPPPEPAEEGPTGEPPDHTVGVDETLWLCGSHEFGTLTVYGELKIATTEDFDSAVTDGLGPRRNCENTDDDQDGALEDGEYDIEHLTLFADEIIVGPDGLIEGTALAEGQIDGNGGGGHGGAGGPGSEGDGAPAFDDTDPPYQPEEGGPGGAENNGRPGGAALAIHTRILEVQPDDDDPDDPPGETAPGTVRVDGQSGGASAACFNADGSIPGNGGGAGGGLVIAATEVHNDGVISANGGRGGDGSHGGGGGGGGGGGVVEVRVPFWHGDDPTVHKGLGGINNCADEQGDDAPGNGGEGVDGTLTMDKSPWSSPQAPVSFWQRPAGLTIPMSASIPSANAPKGYQVILCAVQKPGDEIDINLALHDQLAAEMPSPGEITLDTPCGSGTIIGFRHGTAEDVPFLPPDDVTNFDLGEDNELAVDGLESGITGLWSVVIGKHEDPPADVEVQDCLTDTNGCEIEQSLPQGPQVILGIDATNPEVEITTPGEDFHAGLGYVTLTFETDGDEGFPFGSGIESIRCRNEGGEARPCASGEHWGLSAGFGDKSVTVEVTDAAGNVGTATVNGSSADIAPVATVAINDIVEGVNGQNGWYNVPPVIEIDTEFSEFEEPADPAIFYGIDGGAERTCNLTSCTVPEDVLSLIGPGEHRLGATAHNSQGYRLSPAAYMSDDDGHWVEFNTDYLAPTTQLDLVADEPDGENDWYVNDPWVVLSAFDQERASGVMHTMYSIDFGAFEEYEGPFQLGPGEHDVCWYSEDVAGNKEATACRLDIRVDIHPADAFASVDGSFAIIPDGDNGWWTSVPTVAFEGYVDGNSGAPSDGAPFRYRVDNGDYIECGMGCGVPAFLYDDIGQHYIHWSTLDEAGNRRKEETAPLAIDFMGPTTLILTGPPLPEGLNDWRTDQPWVRLWSFDQTEGSGLRETLYSVDGGDEQVYDLPFTFVGDGHHTVCAHAVDEAGNHGPEACASFDVDTKNPLASIDVGPPDGGDWHLGVTPATIGGTDVTSGVDAAPLTDPCGWEPPEGPDGPSGTCVSVDGGPFVLAGNPIDLDEGVHQLRAFSIDRAGRRSTMSYETVLVDRSNPVTTPRVFSAAPAANGWYRAPAVVSLTAADGDRNSGVVLTEYRIDGGDWTDYERPFVLGEGVHQILYRSTDAAGRVEVDRRLDVGVDLTPTAVTALAPNPTIWVKLLGLLGPANAQLRWRITENLADHVRVQVVIYDTLGNVVRRLDGGTHAVTPGVPFEGATLWDGRDHTLLGLVPVGIYHYRVVAIDEAGNTSQSGESKPIQIRLAVCLPLIGCI